ncbi:MAG: type I restriction enzyme HsdR N-terminal domain-containing protein [bacterium]|nr:type I restriction enzyme HsdR N-terminal domain-containing protein [bacterium]
MNLALKYPPFAIRLKKEKEQTYVFDFIRKKWLVLTPEEWVRQHVLNYLVVEKQFPASSIAIEKELQLNDLKRRFDIVVFDSLLQPYLIVECKAPYIPLDTQVLEQVLRYNLSLKAKLVMVTNGMSDRVFNELNEMVTLPNRENIIL